MRFFSSKQFWWEFEDPRVCTLYQGSVYVHETCYLLFSRLQTFVWVLSKATLCDHSPLPFVGTCLWLLYLGATFQSSSGFDEMSGTQSLCRFVWSQCFCNVRPVRFAGSQADVPLCSLYTFASFTMRQNYSLLCVDPTRFLEMFTLVSSQTCCHDVYLWPQRDVVATFVAPAPSACASTHPSGALAIWTQGIFGLSSLLCPWYHGSVLSLQSRLISLCFYASRAWFPARSFEGMYIANIIVGRWPCGMHSFMLLEVERRQHVSKRLWLIGLSRTQSCLVQNGITSSHGNIQVRFGPRDAPDDKFVAERWMRRRNLRL